VSRYFLILVTPNTSTYTNILMVQITGNIVSTRKWTSSGGRVTHIPLAFPFRVTCKQLQPHENNHVCKLMARSRHLPCPHEYISLMRIFLCCTVEYSLSVVNATTFFCFSSVTDHLLSAMPHLSIKTRYRVILFFLFIGGMRHSLFKKD